jgi:diguanylate cyclase (GGDEF)-like protein
LDGLLPLLESCPVLDLRPEETLLDPDEPHANAYVLLCGRLRVEVGARDDEPLSMLEPGAVAGELAAFDAGRRSARVVAHEPCRVLELSPSVFWSLLCSSHEVAVNLLRIVAGRLRGSNGAIVQGRKLAELYKRHASIDALTGLHNRRWLDEVLPRQVRRAAMQGEPLGLLMMDIDHFKRFNDQWGHAAGDFVLFGVARLLQERLRPTDLLARYGGEEMLAILPKSDLEGAVIAAERVRAAIAETELEMTDGTMLPQVTLSIGAADTTTHASPEALLAAADAALYRAKRAGRNRVERG